MLNQIFNHFLHQAQNAYKSKDADDEPEQAAKPSYDGSLTKRQKYAWAGVGLGIFLMLLIYPLNLFGWLITSASYSTVSVILTWVIGFSFLFIASRKQRSDIPFPAPWPAFIGVYAWACYKTASYPHTVVGVSHGGPHAYLLFFFALAGLYQVIMGRYRYWPWLALLAVWIFSGAFLISFTSLLLIPLMIESFKTPTSGFDQPPKILRFTPVVFLLAQVGTYIGMFLNGVNLGHWPNYAVFIFLISPFFVAAHLQLLLTPGWWRWELIKLRAIGGLFVVWGVISIFFAIKGFSQIDLLPLIGFFAIITTWPVMYLLPLLIGPGAFSKEMGEVLRGLYRVIMIKLGWSQKLAERMDIEWAYKFYAPADNPIWKSANQKD